MTRIQESADANDPNPANPVPAPAPQLTPDSASTPQVENDPEGSVGTGMNPP
jgi:hypothetical protein